MKDLLKRFALWLLQGIIGAVFVLCGAVVLVEWMAGCGETYVDSNGHTHTHQCLIINFKEPHQTLTNTTI